MMMMKNVASKRNLALELILQLDLKVLKYHFGLKDFGEKWSRIFWNSTCPFRHCYQLMIFNRFLFLGRENVDRVIREICASSRKWTPVLENHQRILSRGINLEFDTYMKGILLPQDYNEIVRLAIRRLTPRKNSRKSSTSSTLSVPRSINWCF